MTRLPRLLLSFLAILLPALSMVGWHLSSQRRVEQIEFFVPNQIGPWKLTEEIDLDAETLGIIKPDAYVLRRYDAFGRSSVIVYIGFYAGRGGYGKGSHDPEICYPAHGWEIVNSRSHQIGLSGQEELTATMLQAQKNLGKQMILYWFQPANRWPRTSAWEQLLRVADAVRGSPQYAFVRLSGITVDEGVTRADLSEFAAAAARVIRQEVEFAVVPEFPPATSSKMARNFAP